MELDEMIKTNLKLLWTEHIHPLEIRQMRHRMDSIIFVQCQQSVPYWTVYKPEEPRKKQADDLSKSSVKTSGITHMNL